MSVEGWKSLSEIGGLVALLLTLFFSGVLILTTRELNGRQAAELQAFHKSLADAETGLAVQQQRAANAEAELARLKAQVTWRTLSVEQGAFLQGFLFATPGQVNLRYTNGDSESLYLAIQVSEVLKKARWEVAVGGVTPPNGIVFGILISTGNDKDTQTLRSAFTKTGIAFGAGDVAEGFSLYTSTISGAPTLFIGSKPPTLP